MVLVLAAGGPACGELRRLAVAGDDAGRPAGDVAGDAAGDARCPSPWPLLHDDLGDLGAWEREEAGGGRIELIESGVRLAASSPGGRARLGRTLPRWPGPPAVLVVGLELVDPGAAGDAPEAGDRLELELVGAGRRLRLLLLGSGTWLDAGEEFVPLGSLALVAGRAKGARPTGRWGVDLSLGLAVPVGEEPAAELGGTAPALGLTAAWQPAGWERWGLALRAHGRTGRQQAGADGTVDLDLLALTAAGGPTLRLSGGLCRRLAGDFCGPRRARIRRVRRPGSWYPRRGVAE